MVEVKMTQVNQTTNDNMKIVRLEQKQETQVQTVSGNGIAIGGVSGEIGLQDIVFPRLEIAYGVGKYAEKNIKPGTWVYDGNLEIAGLNDKLLIYVLAARKYYRTWTTVEMWNSGVKPVSYATLQDAKAAGETIEWRIDPETKASIPPSITRAIMILALVRKPDMLANADPFHIEIDGKKHAIALIHADKTMYNTVATAIIRAAERNPVLGLVAEKYGELLVKNNLPQNAWLLLSKFNLYTYVTKKKMNVIISAATQWAGINNENEVKELAKLYLSLNSNNSFVSNVSDKESE